MTCFTEATSTSLGKKAAASVRSIIVIFFDKFQLQHDFTGVDRYGQVASIQSSAVGIRMPNLGRALFQQLQHILLVLIGLR